MKMTYTVTMASALLLAAGCAHEERDYSSTETGYSSGHISEYNSTAPSLGGSYSADGSYSSGGGGSYASRPDGNYSGTVGADGTYTPYANTDTSSAVGGYAGSSGSGSDEAVVAQVRESLRQDPEIALIVPNIQISARNGAVILSGSVQSEEQRRQIFSRVQNITGVVAVNNQLNVMAGVNGQNQNGQNVNAQNPGGSQLNPTGSSSDSQRLYKDANGQDNSTNNALNSTSRPNGGAQIYQDSNQSRSGTETNNNALSPTSSDADSNLRQGSQWQAGQNQNTNNLQPNDALNPTSRTNGSSQIYHDSNENNSNQQQNGNSSTNSLNPTSRSGGQSQMYQNNQQQNQGMNESSNSLNSSSNSLSPTSRENGSSQIYQNGQGGNSQNQNTSNSQSTGQNQ